MIGRRCFLKLAAGGVAAAATGRLPLPSFAPLFGTDDTAATLLRPVEARNLDADGDFAASLMGLLVNSRTQALDGASLRYPSSSAFHFGRTADTA